ncbi:Kinesin-4 [Dendrobium catenatum]|uniref:Kinesin-4 n=1 Tax=Dendrobium catenatum TaxID=906689 RepID=A0A2I0WJJ2_9ASPA|nr:Kinesin-4 [Dendrobium catenatum]
MNSSEKCAKETSDDLEAKRRSTGDESRHFLILLHFAVKNENFGWRCWNEIDAVENVVIEGNIVFVSSNRLGLFKPFAGNEVEVARIIGPPSGISDVGSPAIPVVLIVADGGSPVALVAPIVVLVPPNQAVNDIEVTLSISRSIVPSSGNFVEGGVVFDVPHSGEVVEASGSIPCLLNLVTSHIVSPYSNIVVSDGEAKFSDEDVSFDPGNRDCVPSEGGFFTLNCCEDANASILKGEDYMVGKGGMVNVPISVISNVSLLPHLSCSVRDYEIMHVDWLNVEFSLTDGEEFDENSLDWRENVDLSILQIIDDDLSLKNRSSRTIWIVLGRSVEILLQNLPSFAPGDFLYTSSRPIWTSSRPIGTVENIGMRIVLGTVQDDPKWSDRPGTIWRSAGPCLHLEPPHMKWRFQAATWLEKMVGPLGLPSQQPSEQEFVSCLKNGLVLCNAINKIQPGAVPKVVTNQSLGLTWENQTLPAYQYFENIRNFLDAVDELKIPSFEASDIERDTVEAGSVGKIVDCILGLKAYHDWKQFSRGSGAWKYVKSPMVSHAKVGIHSKMPALSSSVRYLDMSAKSEKLQPMKLDDDQRTGAKVDSLVQAMTDILCNSKENIDQNIFDSWQQGTVDPVKLFNRIISSCLQEQQNCSFCQGKTSCNHWQLMESQKTELKIIFSLKFPPHNLSTQQSSRQPAASRQPQAHQLPVNSLPASPWLHPTGHSPSRPVQSHPPPYGSNLTSKQPSVSLQPPSLPFPCRWTLFCPSREFLFPRSPSPCNSLTAGQSKLCPKP